MERSSRVLTLILPRTSIFPPRCMRNVRSETLPTFTPWTARIASTTCRSEEHTSELQSQSNLVCRLLLEKKKYASYAQQQQHFDKFEIHVLPVHRNFYILVL